MPHISVYQWNLICQIFSGAWWYKARPQKSASFHTYLRHIYRYNVIVMKSDRKLGIVEWIRILNFRVRVEHRTKISDPCIIQLTYSCVATWYLWQSRGSRKCTIYTVRRKIWWLLALSSSGKNSRIPLPTQVFLSTENSKQRNLIFQPPPQDQSFRRSYPLSRIMDWIQLWKKILHNSEHVQTQY